MNGIVYFQLNIVKLFQKLKKLYTLLHKQLYILKKNMQNVKYLVLYYINNKNVYLIILFI